MAALGNLLRTLSTGLGFWCPGCDEAHVVSVAPGGWTWDGNMEAPTFAPSVLVTGGHYAPGHKGDCWCTYNAQHPDDPSSFKCERCHLFVRVGRIEFLGDCTHALAGQTVALPPWPDRESAAAPPSPVTDGAAKESIDG